MSWVGREASLGALDSVPDEAASPKSFGFREHGGKALLFKTATAPATVSGEPVPVHATGSDPGRLGTCDDPRVRRPAEAITQSGARGARTGYGPSGVVTDFHRPESLRTA